MFMTKLFSWKSWDLDIWTVGWACFLLFFFVWEYLSGRFGDGREMLTDHLRPVFDSAPVTWYMAMGLWLWLGPHFLFPSLERKIFEVISGG